MARPSPTETPVPPAAAPQAGRAGLAGRVFRGPLQSLAIRNYRLLWLGMAGHSSALWMEIVARNWLVWELTGSGLALGLVNVFRTAPVLLLALPAGVLSDRVNRRSILIISQLANVAIYSTIAVLLVLRLLEIWHIYALMFARGAAISFNQPARQALTPTLVDRGQIPNAVALQQAAMNGSRFLGPVVASALIAWGGGTTSVFIAMAALYVLVTWTTFLLRLPSRARWEGPRPSPLRDILEGLRYMVRQPVALGVLSLTLAALFFGQSYQIFLPYFAQNVFHMGGGGYGTFQSVIGVGALLGTLLVASLGDFRGKGLVVVGALLAEGVFLMLFAFTPWVIVAFVIAASFGFADSTNRVVSNGLLLSRTDAAYHGRLMSLQLLDRGFVPIGGLIGGALLDSYGATPAMMVLGIGLVLSVGILALLQPRFLRTT